MPIIRILPGGRFNEGGTINLAVNGARKDFAIGAVITVTDEEFAIIRDTGASYTYGDGILGGDQFLDALSALLAQASNIRDAILTLASSATDQATAQAIIAAARAVDAANSAAAAGVAAAPFVGSAAGQFLSFLSAELGLSGMRVRIARRLYATLDPIIGFYPRKLRIPQSTTIDDDTGTSIVARLLKSGIAPMLGLLPAEMGAVMRIRIGRRLLATVDTVQGFYPRRITLPVDTRLIDDPSKTLIDRIGAGAATDLTKAFYWGDSRTAGAGEAAPFRFPEYINTLLPGSITNTNKGIGGQTSIMIAARQGGVPLLLSVTGNTIPTSGSVAVTAFSTDIFSSSGVGFTAGSHTGTLAGIAGTYASDGSGSGGLTFTRSAPGAATPTGPFAPFVTDAGKAARNAINFIDIGTNGAGLNSITGKTGDYVYETVRYTAAMAKYVRDKGGIPVVGSVIHSNPAVMVDFTQIDLLNNLLKVALGGDYLDFASAPTAEEIALANTGVGSTYTFTANDNADLTAGRWPRGYFSDTVHFNRWAQYIQALRVERFLRLKGVIQNGA